MILLSIGASFIVAMLLRDRGTRAIVAIPSAAVIVPLAVSFETFVYPASAEAKMWWVIAVPTSMIYGLIVAMAGYGLVALIQKIK